MWYEVIHDTGSRLAGREGIVSFESKEEAERVAKAFRRFLIGKMGGKLVVAEKAGENG